MTNITIGLESSHGENNSTIFRKMLTVCSTHEDNFRLLYSTQTVGKHVFSIHIYAFYTLNEGMSLGFEQLFGRLNVCINFLLLEASLLLQNFGILRLAPPNIGLNYVLMISQPVVI